MNNNLSDSIILYVLFFRINIIFISFSYQIRTILYCFLFSFPFSMRYTYYELSTKSTRDIWTIEIILFTVTWIKESLQAIEIFCIVSKGTLYLSLQPPVKELSPTGCII